jgi:hypothetical protein
MSDQRSISPEAAPRLTSHLRALSLIAPLQRAEDNKGMLHVAAKAAERVDMRYLALAAIESLIDRMGAGGTANRAELIEYLADLARLQSQALSDADASALAEHVFDGLTNARDRRARFKVRSFDPDEPDGVIFEFALLRAEPHDALGQRPTFFLCDVDRRSVLNGHEVDGIEDFEQCGFLVRPAWVPPEHDALASGPALGRDGGGAGR